MIGRLFALAITFATPLFGSRALAQGADHVSAQHRDENGQGLAARSAGVAWALTYNADANAVVGGGQTRGGAYLQRVGLIADADLSALVGWRGATGHLSVHSIAGVGLSGRRVGNLLTVSGLEAEPALRLFNLWVEQKLGDGATLRVGQFTAGQEFAVSATASLFVNSTFGWPGSFALDLPSGGPAYPLAAPGARLAWAPNPRTTVRLAVFSGDPAGKGEGDPQRRDRHGLNGFRLKGEPFLIGEVGRNAGGSDPAWSVAVGGWLHLERFDTVAPRPGEPIRREGDYALYGMADARLGHWGARSLHGFVRASASPGDRNLVDLYLDGGLSLGAPFRGRPHDVVGLGFGVARLSPRLGAAAHEAVIEASYRWQVSPAVSLQPNAQWILRPGGAAAAGASRSAVVMGLRASARL